MRQTNCSIDIFLMLFVGILVSFITPEEIFSQKAQSTNTHQELGQIHNEAMRRVQLNIKKINEICEETNDLEAISWGISAYSESLAVAPEISALQLDSLLMDKKANWKTRFFAAEIIPMLSHEQYVIDDLMEILKDKGENEKVRGACARAIGHIGSRDAVPILIECLESPSVYLRERAIWALEDIGDVRAVEPLIRHLDDSYWMVQVLAIRTLSRYKDEKILSSLVKKFNDNTIPDHPEIVRLQALMAISKIRNGKSTELLIEVLENPDYGDLRLIAADGLKNVPRNIAIPELVKALNDRNELLRLHAAQSLLFLKAKETEHIIAEAQQESKSKYIHGMLEKVLNEFGRQR